jgi:hypothetical protein
MELPHIIPVPLEWSAVALFSFGFTVQEKTRSDHKDQSGEVIQTFIAGDAEDGRSSHQ